MAQGPAVRVPSPQRREGGRAGGRLLPHGSHPPHEPPAGRAEAARPGIPTSARPHAPLLPPRPPRPTASGRAPGGSPGPRAPARPAAGEGAAAAEEEEGAGPAPQRPGPASETEPPRLPQPPTHTAPGVGRARPGLMASRRLQTRARRAEASTPPPPPNVRQPRRAEGGREPGRVGREDAGGPERASRAHRTDPVRPPPPPPGSPVHLARPTPPQLSLRRSRLAAPLAPLALFVFVLFYPVTRGRLRGVDWPRGGAPAANRGGEAAAAADREGSETWRVGAGRWPRGDWGWSADGRRMRTGLGGGERAPGVGGCWGAACWPASPVLSPRGVRRPGSANP